MSWLSKLHHEHRQFLGLEKRQDERDYEDRRASLRDEEELAAERGYGEVRAEDDSYGGQRTSETRSTTDLADLMQLLAASRNNVYNNVRAHGGAFANAGNAGWGGGHFHGDGGSAFGLNCQA